LPRKYAASQQFRMVPSACQIVSLGIYDWIWQSLLSMVLLCIATCGAMLLATVDRLTQYGKRFSRGNSSIWPSGRRFFPHPGIASAYSE
jgi:hypothetical protein